MRPWARWAARTALVAVVSAAAGGGLSGLAFAGTSGDGTTGGAPLLGGSGPLAPLGADVCSNTSALLGIALVGCRSGVAASFRQPHAAAGDTARGASAPAATAGATGTASAATAANGAGATNSRGTRHETSSASTGSVRAATSDPGSPGFRQTFGDTLNAPGLGANSTDNPASAQSGGLGTLPGLADLPSATGLTETSAGRTAPGGSTLMPSSALSAADATGMSSDSFAALAIGALLAGAAALKIASRRARDRKAGIGAAI